MIVAAVKPVKAKDGVGEVKTTHSGCCRALPRETVDRVGISIGNGAEFSTGRIDSGDSLGICIRIPQERLLRIFYPRLFTATNESEMG